MKAPTVREQLAWAFSEYRRFCGLLQIVPKGGERQQLVLNEIQKRRIARRTAQDVVLKARQVGMTTEECARDVSHFLTHRGARVVCVVQSMTTHEPMKQVSEIYRVMFDGLRKSGLALNFTKEATSEWVLADRDASLRIIEAGAQEATAQKKGRAGTITRLHATEVAFWEHADETLLAMLQCVPDGGEIVFESTPNGAAGPFFEHCNNAREGRSGFQFLFFAWYENPAYRTPLAPGEVIEPSTEREKQLADSGVGPEQLKWRRQKVAQLNGKEDLFDQEYPSDPETCFLIKGRTFFVKAECLRLLRACQEPLVANGMNGRLRIWKRPEPGKRYVIGVDTSEGIEEPGVPFEKQKADAGAAIIRERGTGEHVATLWGQYRPDALADAIVPVARLFNLATVGVERNNHGHTCLLWLEKHHHYPHIFHDIDGKAGWLNNAPKRTMALDNLEAAHRGGTYSTQDRALVGQQLTFVIGSGGKAEASTGAHDDLVLADMISWDLLCRPEPMRSALNAQPA